MNKRMKSGLCFILLGASIAVTAFSIFFYLSPPSGYGLSKLQIKSVASILFGMVGLFGVGFSFALIVEVAKEIISENKNR